MGDGRDKKGSVIGFNLGSPLTAAINYLLSQGAICAIWIGYDVH